MTAPTPRRLAAGLAATAVAAAAAVGLAAPAQAQPSDLPIVDGTVTWGVKESFRSYITSPIAGGQITTEDGASENDAGLFEFPVTDGTYSPDTHDTESITEGGVHFWGHDGELDLTFANLRVTTDHAAETGVLHADVTEAGSTETDIPFAELDLAGLSWEQGELTTIDDVPAVLTTEGAEAFAGFYSEGEELDPVSIAIEADSEGPGQDPTDPGQDPADDEQLEGVLEIVDGRADWGVKESFRTYVTGPIAGGQITTEDGASENADGTFRFGGAEGGFDSDTEALDATFGGTVHFSGHDGQLELDLTGVSVRGTGDDLSLSAGDTELVEIEDVVLAVEDGGLVVDGANATLTAAGADFFAADVDGEETRFYEEGEQFDPVSFTLAFDENVDLDDLAPGGGEGAGAGGPKLPSTGAPLTVVLAAAGALLVAGAGAVVFARRRAFAA